MRAGYPDTEGFLERNGGTIFYEVYENERPTILLAQSWQTSYSRQWKMQIPYLARHFRVATYDPVGNGKSDRDVEAIRLKTAEVNLDSIAVLDETGT